MATENLKLPNKAIAPTRPLVSHRAFKRVAPDGRVAHPCRSASHLGCSVESLFAQSLHVVTHGAELADYDGIFALFRSGGATVSFPPDRIGSLRRLLPSPPVTPDGLAGAYGGSSFMVIGPAYIGYAEAIRPPSHPVRSLTEHDDSAVRKLRAACSEIEWEHGGSVVGEHPASGIFVGSELVALAGYEVWGDTIAHISVITNPAFRGRGFGRSAVAPSPASRWLPDCFLSIGRSNRIEHQFASSSHSAFFTMRRPSQSDSTAVASPSVRASRPKTAASRLPSADGCGATVALRRCEPSATFNIYENDSRDGEFFGGAHGFLR